MALIYLFDGVETNGFSEILRGNGGSAIVNIFSIGVFVPATIYLEQRLGSDGAWVPVTLGDFVEYSGQDSGWKIDYFSRDMEIRAELRNSIGTGVKYSAVINI